MHHEGGDTRPKAHSYHPLVLFIGEHHDQPSLIQAQAMLIRRLNPSFVVMEHFDVPLKSWIDRFNAGHLSFKYLVQAYELFSQEGFNINSMRPIFDLGSTVCPGFPSRWAARGMCGSLSDDDESGCLAPSQERALLFSLACGDIYLPIPGKLSWPLSGNNRACLARWWKSYAAGPSADSTWRRTDKESSRSATAASASDEVAAFGRPSKKHAVDTHIGMRPNAFLQKTHFARFSQLLGACSSASPATDLAAPSSTAGCFASISGIMPWEIEHSEGTNYFGPASVAVPFDAGSPFALRIFPAQVIKDTVMAGVAAKATRIHMADKSEGFSGSDVDCSAVVICGAGHCDFGLGAPVRTMRMLEHASGPDHPSECESSRDQQAQPEGEMVRPTCLIASPHDETFERSETSKTFAIAPEDVDQTDSRDGTRDDERPSPVRLQTAANQCRMLRRADMYINYSLEHAYFVVEAGNTPRSAAETPLESEAEGDHSRT